MSFDQSFQEGVKSFQEKDFAKAAEHFSAALVEQPENSAALTNMALTQHELGQKMAAYVYFKKAVQIDPGNLQAQQGLEFLKSQVEVRDVPHQIEPYERARDLLVTPVAQFVPYTFSLIMLLVVGIRTIRHFARRRQAYAAGEDRPSFGPLNWFFTLVFIFSVFWSSLHTYDQSIPRGFIKAETVSLRSAPSIGSPAILELNGGLEVRILREQDGWIQVQYPGTFSGWLQKESLLEL